MRGEKEAGGCCGSAYPSRAASTGRRGEQTAGRKNKHPAAPSIRWNFIYQLLPGSFGGWTHPPLELVQDSAVILLAPFGFSGFLKTRWRGRREEGGRNRSSEECESLPKPEQPEGAGSRGGRTLLAFLGPWSTADFCCCCCRCTTLF